MKRIHPDAVIMAVASCLGLLTGIVAYALIHQPAYLPSLPGSRGNVCYLPARQQGAREAPAASSLTLSSAPARYVTERHAEGFPPVDTLTLPLTALDVDTLAPLPTTSGRGYPVAPRQ